MTELLSPNIEALTSCLAKLPGIGRKTALRLTLYLLKASDQERAALSAAIGQLCDNLYPCEICDNLSTEIRCNICSSAHRNPLLICVVEDLQDLIAIEKTGRFAGVYHILGGLISPMAGKGPGQLNIEKLISRVAALENAECILALSATLEGETTAFYIARRLSALGCKISYIARGLPVGSQLAYADEQTLARALEQRQGYANPLPSSSPAPSTNTSTTA